MNRIAVAALALLIVGSSATEARSIRLTGLISPGARICAPSGCRQVDGPPLSVFVMRAAGDVARVRHRGDIYSVDADRVSVRLSRCELPLKAYMSGAKCPSRR